MSRIPVGRICAAAVVVVPLIAGLAPGIASATPTSVACDGVCGPPDDDFDTGFYTDPDPQPATHRQYIVGSLIDGVPTNGNGDTEDIADLATGTDAKRRIGWAYCDPNDSVDGGGADIVEDDDSDVLITAQHPTGTGGPTADDPPHGWSAHVTLNSNTINDPDDDKVRVYAICRDDTWPAHDFS